VILYSISEPVQSVKKDFQHLPFDDLWLHAVKKNVLVTAEDIIQRSIVIKELLQNKQLTLQPCIYLMTTGKIELLNKKEQQ
jgi:carbonic anhydrase